MHMRVRFVKTYDSFSWGTHGKVFTQPSAEMAPAELSGRPVAREMDAFQKGGDPLLHTCQR